MTAREADEVLVSDDASKTGRVFITVVHGRYETGLNVSAAELVRLRAAIDAHLSTRPADDMHAHNVSEMLAEARKLVASWDLKGSWTSESPIGLVTRLAAALELASAPPRRLVTPPADDVREALARALRGEMSPGAIPWEMVRDVYLGSADRLLAAFEVRPRGTVTDAEVPDMSGFEGTRAAVEGLTIRGGESS